MAKTEPSFLALRDTREQPGHGWTWAKRERCLGTEVRTMGTGDYTLEGWEARLTVERKATPSELAGWVFQDRCEAELERMKSFQFAYLLLEFSVADLEAFPRGSDIPYQQRKRVRVRGPLLLKRLHELQLSYPHVRTQFVGGSGKSYCLSLFKRLTEQDNVEE